MNRTESGRRAVVTGGARGIGLAIVRRLAEDGFAVTAADILKDPLHSSVSELRGEGLDVGGVFVDVTNRRDVTKALHALERIDVVVAAHGIILVKPFEEISDEEFNRVLLVNLGGTFIVFQEALKRMIAGGRMIAISSRGVLGDSDAAPYIASKAAIVGLVRAMAFEFRQRDIAVNAIAPGFTDTDMVRQSYSAERFAAAAKNEPRRKAADPAEIANAVSFLAAKRTTFITGQTLFVDGGKSLGGLSSPI